MFLSSSKNIYSHYARIKNDMVNRRFYVEFFVELIISIIRQNRINFEQTALIERRLKISL